MTRSRLGSSSFRVLAAAGFSALVVVVAAGSLLAPAGAQTQPSAGAGAPKIAAIKACAEKAGITVNSLADLKQLSTDQRAALKQCLTSNGVNFGGPKIAAIKACGEKAGISVNSLAELKQLSSDQIAALKQCVLGSRSSGTI